jgi:glycosyltransferase involved in cell wall biosynthesis
VSLIEAMAAGALAIGSDVPGIREVLGGDLGGAWTARSGAHGAWVELLIRALALSAEERERVAERAQARAYAAFSPLAYVATLESLYRELLAERRLGRQPQV